MPSEEHDNSIDDLVERAKCGDQFSLQQLLLEFYSQWLRRISRKLPASMGSVIGAEDIVQEAFTKVYQGIGTLRSSSRHSFIAWVDRIVDNEVNDQIRKWKAAVRGGQYNKINDQSLDNLVATLSRDATTPSRAIGRAEAAQALRIGISLLPKHYQQVVIGRIQGKSWTEIAEQLEKRIPAVRGIFFRAIARLRDDLGRMSAYLSSK